MWSVELRIAVRFFFGRVPMGDLSGVHFPFVVVGLSFLDFGFRCPCGTGGFPLRVECVGEVRRLFLFWRGSDG